MTSYVRIATVTPSRVELAYVMARRSAYVVMAWLVFADYREFPGWPLLVGAVFLAAGTYWLTYTRDPHRYYDLPEQGEDCQP